MSCLRATAMSLMAGLVLSAVHLPAQGVPEAIPARFASGTSNQSAQVDTKGQIEVLTFDSGSVELPVATLPQPLGDAFSVNLWLQVAPSAEKLLNDAGSWTDAHPMTVWVLKSADNSQRLVLRLPAGGMAVAGTSPSVQGWPAYKTGPLLQAGAWYMLTFTKSGQRSAVYVNGELVMQDFAGPVLDQLDRVEFGRFGRLRPFYGTMLEPRFYDSELSAAAVRKLAAERLRQVSLKDQGAVKAQTASTYAQYRALTTTPEDLHPLIEQLHVSATVLPMEGRQDLLICGTRTSYFGWRLAYYRQIGTDARGLPYYDTGSTVEGMPGAEFMAVSRSGGRTDLFASGQGSPYGDGSLLHYRNTTPGQFRYAPPQPVLINGKHLGEAFRTPISGWYIGPVDDDDTPDLLVAALKPGGSSYWPDGEGMWSGVERTNSGKDRGYDIQGKWLGGECVSELYWARGSTDADGNLAFNDLRKVSYRVPGFSVQWKSGERERALAIADLDEGPVVIHTGSVDQIMAMPYEFEDGEMICGEARPLLQGGMNIQGTYFVHSISALAPGRDGKTRLLLDGNPGRLIAIEGDRIGDFEEVGPLLMRGGALAVDSLATPARADWDGDGTADLIIGDASGWLTFWKGTSDPWVYRAGELMKVDGVPVHHQAGLTGSIQGPNEKRWGYLQPTVGDWDNKGTPVIITSDIEGYLTLYRQGPTVTELARPERFQRYGEPYQAAWRSRPAIIPASARFGGHERPALLHLDYDGQLAVAEVDTDGSIDISRLTKLEYANGTPVILCGPAGSWGRAELSVTDWDGNGVWDVVFGTIRGNHRYILDTPPGGASPLLLKNVGSNEHPVFAPAQVILPREGDPIHLGIHTASAWPTRLSGEELPGVIVGAEDGKVYGFPREELKD
ncbi:LamG domain-containing protein [Ruficoccus amylovorans]|uniref:LamG domain-containing protein n=1 Tax=Ruficoccus amylovorans TaxID=1804625 RepID=A0A842HCB5_9BACT|nr:LamG domain-containing protein [Ruficoccus amylovorans]MBC2593708.1 LamG domain-containing protein [Ruficoccus amylovorans]